MFNMVMGIVMIGIGVISVARAFFTQQMAGYIFFGVLMIGFGVVELIRSRSIKARKQAARDREFDMYNLIASQMGVKINPITGEVMKDEQAYESSVSAADAGVPEAEADNM